MGALFFDMYSWEEFVVRRPFPSTGLLAEDFSMRIPVFSLGFPAEEFVVRRPIIRFFKRI